MNTVSLVVKVPGGKSVRLVVHGLTTTNVIKLDSIELPPFAVTFIFTGYDPGVPINTFNFLHK